MKNITSDIKQVCIGILKGHERRVKEYKKSYFEILHARTAPDGQPKGNTIGHPTEEKAGKLLQLEQSPDSQRIHAVEQAKNEIGNDIVNEEVRIRLVESIFLNCISGREYPFEVLNLTEFSRMDFYRRKNKFLYHLSVNLKL